MAQEISMHSVTQDQGRKHATKNKKNTKFETPSQTFLPVQNDVLWSGVTVVPWFGRTPLAWSLNLTLQKLYQQYIHYTYKKIRIKNPNITNFVLCISNPTERGFPNFQYWEMSGKSPFSTSYRFFVKKIFFRLANLALVHLIQSYNSPSNDAAEVSTQSLDNWNQLERIKFLPRGEKC